MRYYPGGNAHECDPVFDKNGNEVGIIYDPIRFIGESMETGNSRWYVTVQRDDCTTFKTNVRVRAVREQEFPNEPLVDWIESD